MSIIRTNVNNVKIKPPELNDKPKKIRGSDIINVEFPNIFILAKKFSGKTTTIYNMLPRMASKRKTNIIIISSTVDKDKAWLATTKMLEDEGFRVITFNSVYDENGLNIIDDLLSMIDANIQSMKEFDSDEEEYQILKFDKKVKVKKKYEAVDGEIFEDWDPKEDYLLVLDDVSSELKDKTLEKMMKKNRHYKIKLIISSQHYADLPLGARKNVDLFLLFPLINREILKNIHESTGSPLSFQQFEDLYKAATAPDTHGEKSYNFMYYNVATGQTRQNFNTKLEIGGD